MATNLKYANVTQQNHLPICGVLALAFATSLYFGTYPETVNYDISKARNHLKVCLANGHIQPFPSEHFLTQSFTQVSQSTQLPQEHNNNLLNAYFVDQTLRSENKKRLLPAHNFSFASRIPNKKFQTTNNSSTERKQKSRQNPNVYEREKQSDRRRKYLERQDKHNKNKENKQQREYRQNRRQNQEIRHNEKQNDKQYRKRRRQDEETRNNEKQNDKQYRQKRRQDEETRKSERQGDKQYRQKRRQDEETRNNEKQNDKQYRQKRRQDEETRKSERQGDKQYRQKRRQDEETRKSEKQGDKQYRQKRRQNEETRKSEKQGDKQYRQKRRLNEESRKSERQGDKQYRQKRRLNEESRKSERQGDKQYRQKRRQDGETRKSERQGEKQYRQKRRQDEETRKSERQVEKQYRQKRRQDEAIRECERKKQKQYRQNRRLNEKKRNRERQGDKQYRQSKRKHEYIRNVENKLRKLNKKLKQSEIDSVIRLFRENCKQMPIFICAICYRQLFKKQVKAFKFSKYDDSECVTECLTANRLHEYKSDDTESCSECAKWICFTCDRYLLQNKVPNQASVNSLALPKQPHCLANLNTIEKHLITPIIPFMKIIPLPKGQQKGLHGPVVCVPSNVSSLTHILPRQLSDDTLVKVKLKRKLEYKGHHLFQQVSLQKLKNALEYLKAYNPYYKDITVDMASSRIDPDGEGSIIIPEHDDHLDRNPLTTFSEDRISDEDVVESSTPMVSCLQPEDLQQSQQNPNELLPSEGHSPPEIEKGVIRPEHEGHLDSNVLTTSSEITPSDHEISESSAPMVSCLQPEDLQQSQQNPNDHLSLAPGEGQSPCSVNQEMKIFPYLFPEGIHGFNETRNTKLGLGRYFNSRLFSADNRFASDPQYIFFAQYLQELNSINSAVSIAMRKSGNKPIELNKITAGMITDSSQRDNILNSDKGYKFLKTIRGSPAYWQKCLRDLFAMLKQLGVPTWFCSFSAADRSWPEILEAICLQQGVSVPENPDWTEYCQLISLNPVTACRMFESRVLSFISTVILSPAQPIGNVVDYFYRTEFQSRGWPHIHCLFWCKDSPKFDSSTPNKELINYIDKYVTCSLPDEEQNPELYEIVTNVQLHSKNHSKSCKKGGKTCRFNFPRPISRNTFIAKPTSAPDDTCPVLYKKNATNLLTAVWDAINSLENSDKTADGILQQLQITQQQYQEAHFALASRNTVIFKRSASDLWINPYNEHLLKAWNGNMDIQPVLDPQSCLMYMIKYISKAERELGDVLKKAQEEAQEGHLEPLKQLRKLGNVYLNAREICVMEAVYRVCGMNLKQSSREVLFVPADQTSARITKPIETLKQQDSSSDDVWMTSIIDRYLARPENESFEDLCLADFASKYKVTERSGNNANKKVSRGGNNTKTFKLLNNKGSIIKRKTPAIIRYPHHNREKKSEEYFYTMISMFYPHRGQDFKSEAIETYEQMFHMCSDIILPNMEQYEQLSDELSDAWQALKDQVVPEDAWADIVANQEVQRLEDEQELDIIREELLQDMEVLDIPDICQEEIGRTTIQSSTSSSIPRISVNEHLMMLRSLNKEQSKLFYFVKHWAEQKENGHAEPFHIFLTGGAGTGKSHTIKCIFNEVDRTLTRKSENANSPVVLLVAYIGTAAFNIQGQTIHSAFNINKFSGDFLSEDTANTLRANLQDLQLLIIDEVSMVSTKLLNTIHCRLQQIKKPSKPNSVFGNISVLAVGDFYQIPPISGKSLVSANNSLTDLWSLFHIWTLHEVVRQRGDEHFIQMLNRIRVKPREQQLSVEDNECLQSRVIREVPEDFPKKGLHIAPLRSQRDAYNSYMLQLVSKYQTPYEIEAVDVCHEKKTLNCYRRTEPLKTQDAKIPSHFSVCVNAKIMLTMNLDVADGLTNGAIGTVVAIIPGDMPLGQPAAICVLFDNEKVGINSRKTRKPPPDTDQRATVITPQTEVIQTSPHEIIRHGYPFVLAWSVTMHKIQGITTDKALVSLKGIFKPGMGYVALSRVTSGNGLYLIEKDFDANYIYSDPNIKIQLDLMPKAESLPQWKILYQADSIHTDSKQVILASHNCEGYLPHFQDICNNSFLQRADIIALQETWTTSAMTLHSAFPRHIPKFKHREDLSESHHNQMVQGGGTALFVHEDFDYSVIDTSDIELECVALEIKSPSMTVVSIYRPPHLQLSVFCERLHLLLQRIPTSSSVIMGDFNVNCLNSLGNRLTNTLSNYCQVVSLPTTRKKTLIDHIYINNLVTTQSGIVPTYYSFHDIVYVEVDFIE